MSETNRYGKAQIKQAIAIAEDCYSNVYHQWFVFESAWVFAWEGGSMRPGRWRTETAAQAARRRVVAELALRVLEVPGWDWMHDETCAHGDWLCQMAGGWLNTPSALKIVECEIKRRGAEVSIFNQRGKDECWI
jgi:hypothetical protein